MQEVRAPSRRTVVRGAAWATPAVAVAATVPAFAASPCTTSACPELSFGSVSGTGSAGAGAGAAANGWAWSLSAGGGWTNRGANNPVGFRAPITSGADPMNGKGPWFAATAEPTVSNQVITLTQTGQPALATGCAYTVRFGVVTWIASAVALRLRVLVGTTVIATYTTGTNGPAGYGDRGFQSYVVPSTVSGVVSFQFAFTSGDHGDIKLYQPSVICA